MTVSSIVSLSIITVFVNSYEDGDVSEMYSCFTVEDCERFAGPFMTAEDRVFNNLLIHIDEYALPEDSHIGLGLKSVDPINWDIVDEILADLEFDGLQREHQKIFYPNSRRLLSSPQWTRLLHQYMHTYVGDVVLLETGHVLSNGHRETMMATITGFAYPHSKNKKYFGFSVFHHDIPQDMQTMNDYVHVLSPELAVKHLYVMQFVLFFFFVTYNYPNSNGTDIAKLNINNHARIIGRAVMLHNAGGVDCSVFELARGVIPHNTYRDTKTGKVQHLDKLLKQNKNEKYPAICLTIYGVLNARLNVTNFGDIFIEIDPKQEIPTIKRGLSGTVCYYATKFGIKDFVIVRYDEDNIFQGKKNQICMDEATKSLGLRFYAGLLRTAIPKTRKGEL